MESNKVVPIIRKTIQESGRHFLLGYLDANGYPHSSFMGFVHMNKNLSLVMGIHESSRKAQTLLEQPWITTTFQTRDYKYISKFFGKAFITSSPKTVEKLMGAYPFLKEYFPESGQQALLIQLQTQLIELEYLEEGAKWHSRSSFLVKDGQLEPTDNPVIEGPDIAMQETKLNEFDAIRRQITKCHGEMLMHIMSEDFDKVDDYIAGNFTSEEYPDHKAYIESMQSRFANIDLASAEFNWGLRNFEQNKDGTVQCQYFLDITTEDEHEVSLKYQELWIEEDGHWQLLRLNT